MGKFQSLIIRRGFSTVYQLTTQLSGQSIAARNTPLDLELASGTGLSQCDLEYRASLTLAASTNQDLDLNGVLKDTLGIACDFLKVRGIYVKAADGNTNDVIVKPGAANGFLGPFANAAHSQTLKAGGDWLVTNPVNGWAVTAGTGDKFNFANSGAGTSVTCDIHIIGASA